MSRMGCSPALLQRGPHWLCGQGGPHRTPFRQSDGLSGGNSPLPLCVTSKPPALVGMDRVGFMWCGLGASSVCSTGGVMSLLAWRASLELNSRVLTARELLKQLLLRDLASCKSLEVSGARGCTVHTAIGCPTALTLRCTSSRFSVSFLAAIFF